MTPSSWQDLRDRFLDECCRKGGTSRSQWLDIWHLLSYHPWFRENLSAAAKRLLRRSRCPAEWQQDVEQGAMVLLARRLRKTPCLGIDPVLAERHFAGWMATIINHDCQDSLRKLSRCCHVTAPLPTDLPASEQSVEREESMDLAIALDALEKQEKEVLVLYLKGCTLQEIADELDKEYWKVYRVYRRAVERLRGLFRR